MGKLIFIFGAIIIIAFLIFSFFTFFQNENLFTQASTGDPCQKHNVWGWAWAGAPQASGGEKLGLGWISFSCKNQNTAPIDYGVNINESDGNMTGFAYYHMDDGGNEVGWIDFDISGPYPGAPNHSARIDMNGQISGWIRSCAVFKTGCSGELKSNNDRGGWDGWIKMRKDPTDLGANYGVYIDNYEFHGWAWGGDVMGWISFNCANRGVCTSPTGEGGPSNYKVMTDFNFVTPPQTSDLKMDGTPNYCLATPRRGLINFSWLYEGDYPQEQYTISISTNSGFIGAREITKNQGVSPGGRGTLGLLVLPLPNSSELEIAYNTSYWIRVKTKDNQGTWSEWSNVISFGTASHAYPYPDFSWSPEMPAVEETVEMSNFSRCFDINNNDIPCSGWLWTITNANYVDPTGPNSKEPHIQFTSIGDNSAILRATDADGFFCQREKTIGIKLPYPDWTEIAPR